MSILYKRVRDKYRSFPRWLQKLLFITILSMPILVWVSPFVFTGNKISYLDNDYYFQLYEALRISVIKYHQFPWVNSWMAGGVPLFGNVQLGFPSIQLPLTLIFGTITGIKISWLLYYLIGFWGCFLFFSRSLKSDKPKAVLLSYLFIFSGFFALHFPGGHYTFGLYFAAPWFFWLYFSVLDKKYGWLWFTLAVSMLILSSPHYAAIQTLIVLGLVTITDIILNFRIDRLKKILLAFGMAAGIIAYRMYFVYQYISDFPRQKELLVEQPLAFRTLAKALYLPIHHIPVKFPETTWGWTETGAYIGVLTLILFFITLVLMLIRSVRNRKLFVAPTLVLAGILLALVTAKGDFGILSPYGIMKHLPILSGMRIPARWLIWVVFGILTFIAMIQIENKRIKIIYTVAILIALMEVSIITFGFSAVPISVTPTQVRGKDANFEQYNGFLASSGGYRLLINNKYVYIPAEHLFESTINNYGQVIAAESLVDTRTLPTARCGVNQGCNFIMSKNAELISWSPNKITLKRTDTGPIEINMNPSNYWLVNNKRIFSNDRVAEPSKRFIIHDPSDTITIVAIPKYSIDYWLYKATNLK